MPLFYSFFAALIPMFFYLIFLWRLDKNERESFKNVFRHFLWGAFGAVILGVIFSFFFTSTIQMFISNENLLAFTGAVFIAPIVEETTKGIYLLRTSQKNYFDNITDGLVYGGAIGLGFGMTENLMYFIQYDETFIQWATLVFTRSVFSAVMHAIATATFGAFLAKAKFTNSGKKYVYPFTGLILAMSFHFIWNLTLSLEFTYLVGIIFMIFLIVSFLIIFNLSIKEEEKLISDELFEELNLMGFVSGENKIGNIFQRRITFFDNKIKNKQFLNFATKLAFRKFQARNSSGKQQEIYLSEIEIQRENLKKLIEKKS